MKSRKSITSLTFFLVLIYFVFPNNAYAYLDPGTGSYILQMLIAGFLGILFSLKIYWGKIKLMVTGLLSGAKQDDSAKNE